MKYLMATLLLCLCSLAAHAATLQVGPDKTFTMPSQALAAAKDGDVIEIDAAVYEGDVSYVNPNNLTIRGVGAGRAVLDAKGKTAGRKGIFVTRGRNIIVENIEFRHAGGEVNAAGIRAEGLDLTVRNCMFFECRDALLGGADVVLIEFCEFSHCGHNSNPATHNLYISERVSRLTYRHNYSHHTYEGHLLKTRAQENWILYNRLTDEDGTGSAVADFPNGGVVVLIGNLLHKGAKGQNNRLIAYGMEGMRYATNALYVINNTMVWDNRRANEAGFVRVARAPEGFVPVIRNNLCIGPLALFSGVPTADEAGNLVFKAAAEAGLADASVFDYRLKPDSPCRDKGVDPGLFGTIPLAPQMQYVHPARTEPRPADGRFDCGAFEYKK